MLTAAPRSVLKTFVIGIGGRLTTFEAICLLVERGAELFLYRDSDVLTFHPKSYAIEAPSSAKAFVGSSNLSDPGWVNNVELNAVIDGSACASVRAFIEQLSRSEHSIRISNLESAAQARDDGLLVTEAEARVRAKAASARGAPARKRRPLRNERQRRHIEIDRSVQAIIADLRANRAGFADVSLVSEDVGSFFTDLGRSEANRVAKIVRGEPKQGTFEVNVGVDRALREQPKFWRWPERYGTSPRGRSKEYPVQIRLRTHLTPPEGVDTEGRLWVRPRGKRPEAEFRMKIGKAATLRQFLDDSIKADTILRIDRGDGDLYEVTFVRLGDVAYGENDTVLTAAAAGHRYAYA